MKNKTYCVQLIQIDPECDEIEITANNLKDAKNKANKILKSDYDFGWAIENIEEIR